MLKILLVDDEVAICRGMKKLLLKTDPHSITVLEAYDGIEALDMLMQFDPDILLTDMRMPRMDGLQLLREAKKRKPHLLTAIISAYSDYEYVREALLMSASDYLLKPVSAKDLQDLLLKLKLKRRQQIMNEELEVFERLFHGGAAEAYSPALREFRYALLLACAGPYLSGTVELQAGDALWHPPIAPDSAAVCEKLDVHLSIVNGERPNERFLILAGQPNEMEAVMTCQEHLLKSLQNQPFPVTVVASSDLSIHELLATSKRQRKALMHSVVFGKSSVVHLSESTVEEDGFERETALLLETVDPKRYDLFAGALDALLSAWENGGATQFRILQTLFRVLGKLGAYSLDKQLELETIVCNSSDYAGLRQHVSAVFRHLFEAPATQVQAAKFGTIVNQVEHYLKKNYRESVTMQSLSQEFGLVPNYLSALFKKEIGMTPVEYLMEYRIKEAKRLMDEQPNMLLKQIASEVGYSDQLYFSRVFKKMTGQSPSEYVQSRQQDSQ